MTRKAALSAAVALGALALTAGIVPAQVPQMMNYQVMLTDDGNEPLADQGVTLVFRIYDDPSAGTQQWTETHNVTTNSIGVVSVILGETTPLPVASFGAALWLEVQANGEILLPRRKLVSAPYALHAAGSDTSGAGGDGYSLDAVDGDPADAVYVNASGDVGIGTTAPTWDVNVHRASGSSYQHFTTATTGTGATDGLLVGTEGSGSCFIWNYEAQPLAFGAGNQTMLLLDATDAVRVGNPYAWSGKLDLYRVSVATPEVVLNTDAYGGSATFADEAANTTVLISADNSGTGGIVHVSRDATYGVDEGIDLNGNWASTEQPALRVIGADRAAGFYMNNSGTASVQLPGDAISSAEMQNEPGVARNDNMNQVTLTGGTDVLVSRSITVPGAGYVLALGTCNAAVNHVNGSLSVCYIGLNSSGLSLPSTAVQPQISNAAPTGVYRLPVSVHDLFTVASAGTYTYYFLAYEHLAAWFVDTNVLTLGYFPTAYGTVAAAALEESTAGVPAPAPETIAESEGSPLTPADIAAEQAEAREFHLARVERELAEIRAEVEAMRAEPGAAEAAGAVQGTTIPARPPTGPAAVLTGPSVEGN